MALAALGTCTYNGFTFSPKMELIGLHATPRLDAAQRTVVYTNWQIRILDHLSAASGQTLDAAVTTARQQLQVNGGALVLKSKGFGDLSINAPGSTKKDVLWGPRWTEWDYKIKGRDAAADMVWGCEVNIPEGCTSPGYQFKLMEALFRVSYRQDFSGYSTRSVSGFIRIPQTRASVGTRTLGDNADNYRASINPVAPVGFRRTDATFTIDESKCRLDYSITDVEMPPNAPPPGCIEADASHTVQTQTAASTAVWTGTISASYEVAKDKPKSIAYKYFLDLLTSRVQAAIVNATTGCALITYLNFNDSAIYGKKAASCTASYMFTTTLDTLLAASGLWSPVPNSDYAQWRASLGNGIFSANGRSYAGLQFNSTDEVIVDLCSVNVSTLTAGGVLGQSVLVAGGALQNPYPTPAGSFLDYQLDARLDIDNGVAEMKTLPLGAFNPAAGDVPTDLFQPAPNQGQLPTVAKIQNNVNGFTPLFAPGQALTQTQQRVAPSLSLTLNGRALRAGYPVNPPVLVSVGGVAVVPANREGENYVEQGQVANLFGVPILATRWSQRYAIPSVPNGPIGVPPTPFN